MSAEDDSDPPYVVGRGKPPIGRRFTAGESGNPKGRPKGSKNFATTIQGELKRKVVVNENGRRKRVSTRMAVAKQLVNRAAAGDPKFIPVLLNEARRYEEASGGVSLETLSSDDACVAENIVKRIRAASATNPNLTPSNADTAAEGSKASTAEDVNKDDWDCQ